MSRPLWVPYEIALAFHREQVAEHGGSPGLRSEDSLRAALARPEQRLNFEPGSDLFRLAAAYAFGIAKAHAFVDGNKRVAFAVAVTFLWRNGQYLDVATREAERFMMALAAGDTDEIEFSEWLRDNCSAVPAA